MLEQTNRVIESGKKSLRSLLREKAFGEVAGELKSRGIDIGEVDDEDVEALVQARVDDMYSGIKGFAVGSAFAVLLSAVMGV